jgi:hypothetical protein
MKRYAGIVTGIHVEILSQLLSLAIHRYQSYRELDFAALVVIGSFRGVTRGDIFQIYDEC